MGEAVERQLWCCVIQQSWDDLFAPKPGWRHGLNDWIRNKREAEMFLTKTRGQWARSREDACRAAGIDPDDLMQRAVDALRRQAECK